jgi:ABC-2 type transport system permease protein
MFLWFHPADLCISLSYPTIPYSKHGQGGCEGPARVFSKGFAMKDQAMMGVRRFGRVNWLGTWTLMRRETRRFMNVWSQTVMAPLINAGLFLMIFTIAIGPGRGDVMGVPFMTFLTPGILTMTVIQNAFANTSSSLTSAKMQGNIVDTLMPPLSAVELVIGYLSGAVARGFLVAVVITIGAAIFLGVWVQQPVWVIGFVLFGSILMGGLGMIAGIFANKFDQLSAISNFLVTPLAFLSGTFYSIDALPPFLQTLSHVNPFFYVIDGVRFGMIGVSDSNPWVGLGVVGLACTVVIGVCWRWMQTGYRLKA